jgi:hypothetical protein
MGLDQMDPVQLAHGPVSIHHPIELSLAELLAEGVEGGYGACHKEDELSVQAGDAE